MARNVLPRHPSPDGHSHPTGGDPAPMSKTQALGFVRGFGERRPEDGDEFLESTYAPGHFLSCTGEAHTAIVVWGEEEHWTFSAFAADGAFLTPSPPIRNGRCVSPTTGRGRPRTRGTTSARNSSRCAAASRTTRTSPTNGSRA